MTGTEFDTAGWAAFCEGVPTELRKRGYDADRIETELEGFGEAWPDYEDEADPTRAYVDELVDDRVSPLCDPIEAYRL
jgi:hypothetical protein